MAPATVTLLLGTAIPLWCYGILRRLGGFSVTDAAALAAHYGSVSAVTFIASLTFLVGVGVGVGVELEGYMPALVAILEMPAIALALLLARMRMGGHTDWGEIFHDILSGRSIILLIEDRYGRFLESDSPSSASRRSAGSLDLPGGEAVTFRDEARETE